MTDPTGPASIERVEAYLDDLGLEHFQPYEFLIATDRPGNERPPLAILPNIVPTAIVLDAVRKHYGRAIVITSCYRAPAYNRRVGGARLSQHQAFTATDFGVAGTPARDVAELLRSWRGRWFDAPRRISRICARNSSTSPVSPSW